MSATSGSDQESVWVARESLQREGWWGEIERKGFTGKGGGEGVTEWYVYWYIVGWATAIAFFISHEAGTNGSSVAERQRNGVAIL